MSEYFNPTLGRWSVHVDGNGDSTDDRIENLQIITETEHNAIHRAEREAAWRARKQHEWSFERQACIECGTTERPHTGHGRCSRCYFRTLARKKHGHKPRKYGRTLTRRICAACQEPFFRERYGPLICWVRDDNSGHIFGIRLWWLYDGGRHKYVGEIRWDGFRV